MAEEIISSFGLPKSNIKILPFGIDSNKFIPDTDASQIRERFEWENNPIVISARNFEPVYNIECLINAIPLVIKEVPDAKFMLLGKGTLETRLKEMVEILDISSSVVFVDYVPHDELQKYFSCSDVYVSTSLSDSLGISNLEAMACGLPVILTDIPINKELVKNGLDIDVFPPKNSKILAEKIIKTIISNAAVNRKNNYDIISKIYDWDTNMKEMEGLYFKLIDSSDRK
jgi:glycosyltransferase involved in cell wall biosynthesis